MERKLLTFQEEQSIRNFRTKYQGEKVLGLTSYVFSGDEEFIIGLQASNKEAHTHPTDWKSFVLKKKIEETGDEYNAYFLVVHRGSTDYEEIYQTDYLDEALDSCLSYFSTKHSRINKLNKLLKQ